ncbi:MAG: hypothetical protein PVF65_12345 [Sphingomonadales bacterium]
MNLKRPDWMNNQRLLTFAGSAWAAVMAIYALKAENNSVLAFILLLVAFALVSAGRKSSSAE